MIKTHHRTPSRSLETVEVKSKFGAEFRRFSLDRSKPGKFEEFYGLLQHVHRIPNVDVLVGYADIHGDLLPINNDDNYLKAIKTANPLLRVFLQRTGIGGTNNAEPFWSLGKRMYYRFTGSCRNVTEK
ncbi:partitioning defective 6 homolog beta-like [Rhincodon typus]|uniref:partitioning defective 6 homolog beta-like n=1 Tax=Rhincodon typus TaxID=259920 RepID=UPI002030EEC4|nr:partitioning defective 6 homolog beta-like [Rhincodon typus]